MAVHEGRWLTGGRAQGTQPLLSCQLTRVSRHRLASKTKSSGEKGLLWETPNSLLPLLRLKMQNQSRQERMLCLW